MSESCHNPDLNPLAEPRYPEVDDTLRAYLEEGLSDFKDAVDLIMATKTNSVGFAVVDSQTRAWAVEQLREELADLNPQILSTDDAGTALEAVKSLIEHGRKGARQESSSTILDFSLIDFEDPSQRQSINSILLSLNAGRSLLHNSAMLTTLVVSAPHFYLFQQLPDLYSTRDFVARFTQPIKDS